MAGTVGNVVAYIELRLELLQQGIKKAVSSIKNMGATVTAHSKTDAKKMAQEWQAGFALLSVAVIRAAKIVNDSFGDMIGTFATFEQSLANTQSVAQANTEELLAMEAAARRVGATTRSTASEAANALYYLASAGFSAAESIAALDGVNALAIATQSDLAKTSETVATTIRQYNLETSAATDIANTFTAAITNSLATMDKIAKSFEYVGPIAAGLGLTVEETTGALELLYNKGFSGEKAGRGLRTILVNLADSTSIVNKRLAKLGITFDEINPTTNKLADIFDTLREHEVDATNAAAIFGKVSGVQLASLVAQSSDAKGGLNELTAAVTGTNRAFEAMDIQMDTLQGSIDKFKNAEEALQITTGKQLAPTIRGIVDTGTAFVKMLNSLNPKILALGAGFGLLAANSIALGFAIKAAAVLLAKLGVAAALAVPGLGQIILAIGLTTAAIVGTIAAVTALSKMSFDRAKTEFAELAEQTNVAKEDLNIFYKNANNASKNLKLVDLTFINNVKELNQLVEDLAKRYNLTKEQALILLKTNAMLGSSSAELIAEVEGQIKVEKELNQNRIDAGNETINSELIYLDHLKKVILLQDERSKKEDAQARNTAKAYKSLEFAFKRSVEYQKAFGDSFDRNKVLTDAFKQSMDLLIEQDLSFESDEIQELIKFYAELQTIQEFGGKVASSSAQVRTEVLQQLNEELAEINQLEKANLDAGIAYAAEKARSAVTIKARNALIKEGYTFEGRTLTGFIDKYGKYIKITAEGVDVAQQYIDKLERLGKDELYLNEVERKVAKDKHEGDKDALIAIDKYHNAVRDGIILAKDETANEQIQEYIDKLTVLSASELGLIKIERDKALATVIGNDLAIDAVNAYYDALVDKKRIEQLKENIDIASQYTIDFLNAIDAVTRISIDKQIAMEEELLAKKLSAIDIAEEAALAAAGLLEETELERLQNELTAAVATGDAITIAEAQANLDRYNIKKVYDDLRVAAEDDSNKEIAKLQYKADITSWTAQLGQALRSSYLAILKAYEQLGPLGGIAGAAIMSGLSAYQIGAVIAAKPEKPTFADGGIIPGSSYKGDSTSVLANAGELILNKGQQDNVANQLKSSDKPVYITVNSILDGKVVATNSAKYYRNGQVKL